jgi:hypothetical protein
MHRLTELGRLSRGVPVDLNKLEHIMDAADKVILEKGELTKEEINKFLEITSASYKLTFWGLVSYKHKQRHTTRKEAEEEAHRVLTLLDEPNLRDAHPAMIYGPTADDDCFIE